MTTLRIIAEQLLPVFSMLLVAALSPLGIWLGRQLARKLHVEWQAGWTTMVGRLVVQGVHYAEEWARQMLRKNMTVSGEQKLDVAMRYVNEQLLASGVAEMAADQLRQLIESALHVERPEMDAADVYATGYPSSPAPQPATPAGGSPIGRAAAGAMLLFLVIGGGAGLSCAPLSPGQAAATQTTVSVSCVLVETWCNADVIPSAPERWCGVASGLCRAGEAGLAYVLPQFTERSLAMTSTSAPEDETAPPAPTLTACAEWGLWCAHSATSGADELCAAIEYGCRERAAVTVRVAPAVEAGARD